MAFPNFPNSSTPSPRGVLARSPALLLAALTAASLLSGCGGSTACRCTSDSNGVNVDIACGETTCVSGIEVLCKSAQSVSITGQSCSANGGGSGGGNAGGSGGGSAGGSGGGSAGGSGGSGGGSASGAPAAVANLTATASCHTVSLSWTASSGATSYAVKRQDSGSGQFDILIPGTPSGTNTLTLVDSDTSNLITGTTYYYQVTAHNSFGDSGARQDSASIGLDAPAFYDGYDGSQTRLSYAGDTQVSLLWTNPDGADTTTTYDVLRSTSPNGPFVAVQTMLPAYSMTDTGLNPSSTYYYEVRASPNGCATNPIEADTGAAGSAVTQKGGAQSYVRILDSGNSAPITWDFSQRSFFALDANLKVYPGAGTADGYFTIPNVPAGTNFVGLGTNPNYHYLYLTSTRQFDMSAGYTGRETMSAAGSGTSLNISVNGLAPWDASGLDNLELFTAGANTDIYADLLASPALTAGATQVSMTADWNGYDLIDTVAGDQIYLNDIGHVAATPFPYGAVQKTCTAALTPATIGDGQSATLGCTANAAMTTVARNNTTTLNWNRAPFKTSAIINGTGPAGSSPAAAGDYFGIYGQLDLANHGNSSQVLPTLLQMVLDNGTTAVSESVSYGNPLSSRYGVIYLAQTATTLHYTAPATAACPTPAPYLLNEFWNQWDQLAAGKLPASIAPVILPVTNVQVTTLPALANGTGSPVKVSWTPASGAANSPTLYYVSLHKLGVDNACNTTVAGTWTIGAVAGQTSVTFHPQLLTAGTYYAAVRAYWEPDDMPNAQQPYMHKSARSADVGTFSATFTH